ncbi:MAG: hypothetical protein R2784_16815 [Saprospiraceae bacterium]
MGTTFPVENQYWQEYIFEFKPDKTTSFYPSLLEVKSDVSLRINGNILVDDASDIIAIECGD